MLQQVIDLPELKTLSCMLVEGWEVEHYTHATIARAVPLCLTEHARTHVLQYSLIHGFAVLTS